MPVDWKSSENNERLLACLFASLEESGTKINYKRIAQLFGRGTTGNAIDCNFRKIRAAAKEIKKEFESGVTQPAPPTTPRKPKTPKKEPLSTIKSGRVEKPSTPSKKNKTAVGNEEMLTPPEDGGFGMMDEFPEVYGDTTHGLSAIHYEDEV
ncbi:uncharacterized protein PV09_00461 [Verruconis gallopava]|uniref:Uncharacterized protein n=1 Tax=Verruconis gallopava TaxID=253628 RepID=A0A0D2ASY3_9PEZI|nr:uncharacterized protein PV09_00461 [Verruconis gallopava]KIW09590.1 hypothetical protein PV09_00461 [Verruconis gallopava]